MTADSTRRNYQTLRCRVNQPRLLTDAGRSLFEVKCIVYWTNREAYGSLYKCTSVADTAHTTYASVSLVDTNPARITRTASLCLQQLINHRSVENDSVLFISANCYLHFVVVVVPRRELGKWTINNKIRQMGHTLEFIYYRHDRMSSSGFSVSIIIFVIFFSPTGGYRGRRN